MFCHAGRKSRRADPWHSGTAVGNPAGWTANYQVYILGIWMVNTYFFRFCDVACTFCWHHSTDFVFTSAVCLEEVWVLKSWKARKVIHWIHLFPSFPIFSHLFPTKKLPRLFGQHQAPWYQPPSYSWLQWSPDPISAGDCTGSRNMGRKTRAISH